MPREHTYRTSRNKNFNHPLCNTVHRRGFTLIEIVMVIVIIGMIIVAGINRIGYHHAIKLELAAKKVVSDIRYVQNLAVSEHEELYIDFSGNDTYEVYRMEGVSRVYYANPHTQEQFIVDFKTEPQLKGISISSANFDGYPVLIFSSLGRPRNSGHTDLTAQGQIVLNNSTVITVEPGTGFCSY